MNLKKLVSGIASLTIAASAFAGIAVTANAESTTFDFDIKSLTAAEKGGNTTFAVQTATEGSGLANGENKVLRLGCNANGTGKYLGYQADLGLTTGAVKLSYKFVPFQIRSDKDASILLNFADSKLNTVSQHSVATGKTVTGAFNGVNIAETYNKVHSAEISFNFYNGTYTASATKSDGSSAGTATGTTTSTDIQYLYFQNSDWKYGFVEVDDITIADMAGVQTTFTVTGTTASAPIADAEVTIGNVTQKTDANGQLSVTLPVGTYDYSVKAAGTSQTEESTGAITVAEGDTSKSIAATVNDAAVMGNVTVNYYETGTTTAIQEATNREYVVGTELTADTLNTVVNTADKKYTLNTTESTALPYSVTEGTQTINLYYDVEDAINYTVTAVANNKNVANITSGKGFVGDEIKYSYRKYLADENKKITYSCDASAYTATTAIPSDGNITVAYSAYTGQEAYVLEGEDYLSSGVNDDYSGGKYGCMGATNSFGGQVKVLTLPAGKYSMAVAYYNDGQGHGNRGVIFRDDANEDNLTNEIAAVTIDRYAVTGTYTGTMVLTSSKDLNLTGITNGDNTLKTNQSSFFDYIVVTKTGDITASTVDVSKVEVFSTAEGNPATVFNAVVTANDFAVTGLKFEGTKDHTLDTTISSGAATFIVVYENKAVTNPTVTAIN